MKIELIHLKTNPGDIREITSTESLLQLSEYGVHYRAMVNPLYLEKPPEEFCRRPEKISMQRGDSLITPAAYGCYLAHRKALESLSNLYDYTIICECDAVITGPLNALYDILEKAMYVSIMNKVYYISLGGPNLPVERTTVDEYFSECWHINGAWAYIIPNRYKDWYMQRIKDSEWDGADLWYNHIFCHHREKRYITNKRFITYGEGVSLIDKVYKKE